MSVDKPAKSPSTPIHVPPSSGQPQSASAPPVTANGPPRNAGTIPTPTKYQLRFPEALERAFAPLDDAVVRVVQKRTSGAIHWFVMSLTFFSAIEGSLSVPATMYALGYDRAAGLCFSVLWVLCIVSQIPKKFIFRKRPWMTGRALPIRQDRTSSFPSRAVVCAVVFSWLIAQSLFDEQILTYERPSTLVWLGIVFVSAITAFARINVGAHYASDTICGFFLGVAVINMGKWHEQIWQSCGCRVEDVHRVTAEMSAAENQGWSRFSVLRMIFSTLISYGLTLVSIQGFWVKCSYVYGLLLSSATFRAAFMCVGQSPKDVGLVTQVANHGTFAQKSLAAVQFLTLLLFGMVTRGNKGKFRYLVFTLIYFLSLTFILYWRLP